MKIGFGHLRYSSRDFWDFSLREWQACLKGYQQKDYGNVAKAIDRDKLNELMEKYPDDWQVDRETLRSDPSRPFWADS